MTKPADNLYFDCGPLHAPVMRVVICRTNRKKWNGVRKTVLAGVKMNTESNAPVACRDCGLAVKMEAGKVKTRTVEEISRRLAG